VKLRPYRVIAVAAGVSLVLAMVAAWLLNVPLLWVLAGGVLVSWVLIRVLGRGKRGWDS
jgi:hypothetical protein